MKLLLDSHTLLWWLDDNQNLAVKARAAISDASAIVYVSAATIWEISMKRCAGKLRHPPDLEQALADNQFPLLPISLRHAVAAAELPMHHRDPFDRMLIAQAQLEGLVFVTYNRVLSAYGVPILEA